MSLALTGVLFSWSEYPVTSKSPHGVRSDPAALRQKPVVCGPIVERQRAGEHAIKTAKSPANIALG